MNAKPMMNQNSYSQLYDCRKLPIIINSKKSVSGDEMTFKLIRKSRCVTIQIKRYSA